MELIASLLSVAVLFLAWLLTVRKFSTLHLPPLRHALGALVGMVTMFVVVAMFVFIGFIAPHGKDVTALDADKEPSAALMQPLISVVTAQV